MTQSLHRIRKFIDIELDNIIGDIKAIASIPSPTFNEHKKSEYLINYFKKTGIIDAWLDEAGNVVLALKGTLRKELVFSAHIDTVFPESTKLEVIERDGKLYCPGICDNSTGVVALLYLIKYILKSGIKLKYTTLFVFNTCEEELGNLKGIKYFFDNYAFNNFFAHICVEGHKLGRLTTTAVGSHRAKVTIRCEGGHSWRDNGKPNAIIIASGIIQKLASVKIAKNPKTTFNIGTIKGGTTINSIPAEAEFTLEVRSVNLSALNEFISHIKRIIDLKREGFQVQYEVLGERPCGEMKDKLIIDVIKNAHTKLKITTITEEGSTDSNYPISLNLPSLTIGITNAEKTHSINEFLYVRPIRTGIVQLLAIFDVLNKQE